jgi:hypothetical protein
VALDGERLLIVGAGLVTARFMEFEIPPPGAGLVTVTGKFPIAAMSAAVTDMVTCVALTNAVVRAVPLNVTTEFDRKFVPFTVSVNPAPPNTALGGDSDVIVGPGLFTVV